MAIKWNVKTELVNEETQLRKITATRVDNGDNMSVQTFFIKARMNTAEERNAVWNNIRRQYLDLIKVDIDAIAVEGRIYLDDKEAP